MTTDDQFHKLFPARYLVITKRISAEMHRDYNLRIDLSAELKSFFTVDREKASDGDQEKIAALKLFDL